MTQRADRQGGRVGVGWRHDHAGIRELLDLGSARLWVGVGPGHRRDDERIAVACRQHGPIAAITWSQAVASEAIVRVA